MKSHQKVRGGETFRYDYPTTFISPATLWPAFKMLTCADDGQTYLVCVSKQAWEWIKADYMSEVVYTNIEKYPSGYDNFMPMSERLVHVTERLYVAMLLRWS
jgi:hypothetical protein